MPHSDIDQELIDAAERGRAAKLSELLAFGADPRSREFMALLLAAGNGHEECVRLLMPLSDPKANNSLALRLAAENGHEECVRMLLPASRPLCESDGLLEAVIEAGRAKVAALLIGENPRLVDGLNLSKCIAAAIEKDHADMAAFLSTIIEQKAILGVLPEQPARSPRLARL